MYGSEKVRHAPGETRTPNLLIRSQMLYPIELRAPRCGGLKISGPTAGVKGETVRRYVAVSERAVSRNQFPALSLPAQFLPALSLPAQFLPALSLPAPCCSSMGGTRLELVTSTMSTWRSNQLS